MLKQSGTGSSCCKFSCVRVKCCSKQADKVSTETAEPYKKSAVASRQSVLQSCGLTTAVLLASAGALRSVAPSTSHLLAQQHAEDVQALLHGELTCQ